MNNQITSYRKAEVTARTVHEGLHERRAQAQLTLEIILCSMVGMLLLVSVLGVGDMLSMGQCVVGWISIITGAEIARRFVKLNYLNSRK